LRQGPAATAESEYQVNKPVGSEKSLKNLKKGVDKGEHLWYDKRVACEGGEMIKLNTACG